MVLDSRKTKYSIIISLVLVFVLVASIIIRDEIASVEMVISERVIDSANKLKEKMRLVESFIYTARENMEQNFAQQLYSQSFHPALNKLKDYPSYKISGIAEDTPTGRFSIDGNLTSFVYKDKLSIEVKNEMSAALNLKATFYSALNNINDLKWVYFLSINKFMYSVPNVQLEFAQFDGNIYSKEYWVNSMPNQNRQRRLVTSNVYLDSAGQGYLVTLSLPIYFEEEFLGIIALDVSMDGFHRIVNNEQNPGELFLLDENNSILASNVSFTMGEVIYNPKGELIDNVIHLDQNGFDYYGFDIIDNEITFLQRSEREEKYRLAINNSIRELSLLFVVVIMTYMIYSFRMLITRVGVLANIDPLTGLLNRRAMENSVMPLLSINDRYEQKMCFVLADIDYFKNINDTFGHVVGDEVLVSITRILKSCLRSSDLLSRHGGEEFLIVLPQTDIESGSLLAERIRTSVENTRTGNEKVAVTISIGCIECRKEESFDSAITRADTMLYKAKTTGRNRSISDNA